MTRLGHLSTRAAMIYGLKRGAIGTERARRERSVMIAASSPPRSLKRYDRLARVRYEQIGATLM
jgi:hypothetical protein